MCLPFNCGNFAPSPGWRNVKLADLASSRLPSHNPHPASSPPWDPGPHIANRHGNEPSRHFQFHSARRKAFSFPNDLSVGNPILCLCTLARVGWVNTHYAEILKCYVKAVVAASNQEKALDLVGVFTVIVKLQIFAKVCLALIATH